MTPAPKPNTPKTRGTGASPAKPVSTATTMPAPDHAAPQAKPIPIAPRMRRSPFRMIASDRGAARLRGLRGLRVRSNAETFALQSTGRLSGFKSARRRPDEPVARAERAPRSARLTRRRAADHRPGARRRLLRAQRDRGAHAGGAARRRPARADRDRGEHQRHRAERQ